MADPTVAPGAGVPAPVTQDPRPAGQGPAAPADPPPPAAPAPETARLREWTTTILACAVVAVTLGMLLATFLEATDFASRKDVMLYGLPILGSILGYYFGRVPAERRAEAAEKDRDQVQATAHRAVANAGSARAQSEQHARESQDAKEKLSRLAGGVEQVKALLAPFVGGAAAAGAELAGESRRGDSRRGGEVPPAASAASAPEAAQRGYHALDALSRLL
jgi:hypothetical protein